MDTLYVDINIAEPLWLIGGSVLGGLLVGAGSAMLVFIMLFRISRKGLAQGGK